MTPPSTAFLLLSSVYLFSVLSRIEAVTVCYDRYGCFSDDPPFDRPVPGLPEEPKEIGTNFRLYTRRTKGGEAIDPTLIDSSAFDRQLKVKFIIHGYTQSGRSAWVTEMVGELLKKEDLNVFVVDWSLGSSIFNMYDVAAGNTRLVGAQVAELIEILSESFGVKLADVHIIGHSLGAQTAGFAGEKFVLKDKVLGRITGLDPAGPGFDVDDAAARLDPTDAKLVDVIHTDGRDGTLDSGLGLSRPCGHVDFYPNGGHVQPGCGPSDTIEEVLQLLVQPKHVSLPQMVACNHMKSIAYFTASINSACAMTAYPCSNWQDFKNGQCLNCNGSCYEMGYNADQIQHVPVKMYLETAEMSPHCAPQRYFKVTLHSRSDPGLFSFLTTNSVDIRLIGSKGTVQTTTAKEVTSGEESFLVASTHDIGLLKTVEILFHGSDFYLKKVVAQSSGGSKKYTACFNQSLQSYFMSKSYRRNVMDGNMSC